MPVLIVIVVLVVLGMLLQVVQAIWAAWNWGIVCIVIAIVGVGFAIAGAIVEGTKQGAGALKIQVQEWRARALAAESGQSHHVEDDDLLPEWMDRAFAAERKIERIESERTHEKFEQRSSRSSSAEQRAITAEQRAVAAEGLLATIEGQVAEAIQVAESRIAEIEERAIVAEDRAKIAEHRAAAFEQALITEKAANGEARSKAALSPDMVMKMVKLCHPDKHGKDTQIATEVTQWLLAQRKKG